MATDPTDLDAFLGTKRVPAWRRWAKWPLIALGVVLLLLLGVKLFGAKPGTSYATDTVARGSFTVSVSATGKLAPTTQVTVGSQLSGLVTKVAVDVNDRVTAGQALALIDPEQIDDQIRAQQATLNANQAQVAQAQATVAESQAQLGRLEEVFKLSGGKVPSGTELQTGRADYQRAVAALKTAQANVGAAQAQLAQLQTQRARAVIKSPVNGVVLARQVDPGQTVAASFNTPTLFVIAEDLSKMKLEVQIDEADVGSVKVGQKASFTVDAFPGRTFPAVITRVDLGSNLTVANATSSSSSSTTSSTSSSGQVVSYAADLTVDNPTLELRPGMTATADITTMQKNDVLLVPNAALRFRPTQDGAAAGGSNSGIAGALLPRGRRGGGQQRTASVSRGGQQIVYVKGADGKPQAVNVTTGETNGTVTEITGGDLKPGMEVITGQLAAGSTASASSTRRRSGSGGGSGRRSAAGGSGAGGQ